MSNVLESVAQHSTALYSVSNHCGTINLRSGLPAYRQRAGWSFAIRGKQSDASIVFGTAVNSCNALEQLARERYLQLGVGTKAELEELWRKVFFADELNDRAFRPGRRASREPIVTESVD